MAPAQAAEGGVDERDHRVEVGAGDRAEHEDEGEEAGGCRRRVLEQLQSDVSRGELRRGDPRADHRGGQECRAEELGEEATGEGDETDDGGILKIDKRDFNRYT